VQNPALEVAVARGEGDSTYTELILTLRGCSTEPCQLLVGVHRDVSEQQLRTAIEGHLRQHFDSHRRSDAG